MRLARLISLTAASLGLAACNLLPSQPSGWSVPEALVAPSSLTGAHGLAVDQQGRLLTGSVVGNAIWAVNRQTGAAKVLVAGPEGHADDIANGPKREMAWINYRMGTLRYRENDAAPMKVLAQGLPGLNSLAFDPRNGKLYASQVFLGDALWEIDVAGQKPPRLIAKDLGGFNGFEVGADGLLYGRLWFKHSVAQINPDTGKVAILESTFHTPAAANLDGKGHLWVVDTGAVRTLTRGAVALPAGIKVDGDQLAQRQVVASGLAGPVQMALAADGRSVYVTEAAGKVTHVQLANGRKTAVADGLALPEGIALTPWGSLVVAEAAARKLTEIDLASGQRRTVAADLPIGLAGALACRRPVCRLA